MSEMLPVEVPKKNSEESAPTRPASSMIVDFVEKTGPSGERIFESTANKSFDFNGTLPESVAKPASLPIAEKTLYFNADSPSPVIKENKDLGLSQAEILAGIKARDKDFENVRVEIIHHDRLKDSYAEVNPIAEGDTKDKDGGVGVDNHLAPHSGSEKKFGAGDNKKKEETMPPQQFTQELDKPTPEPVVAEISSTEVVSGTPTLEATQLAPEPVTTEMPEALQDSQVISELVAQPPIPESQAPNPTSEVLAQAPMPEAQTVSAPTSELPIAELAIETVALTPQIEETRGEVLSPEVPVEGLSLDPESNVIDFNQMKESAAKANEGFVTDVGDTQKNFEGQLTDADVPEVGSADFRAMREESDKLGSELGSQIDNTQEKFENLQNRLETQRQEMLKNAEEVMAAASAEIEGAREENIKNIAELKSKKEIIEANRAEQDAELAREEKEIEREFDEIVQRNNPILERADQLTKQLSVSSVDRAAGEPLEKMA